MTKEDQLYQGYIEGVYQQSIAAMQCPVEDKEQLAKEHVCPEYGELLYPSLIQLLQAIKLDPTDIFLDLGSGLGKLAIQLYLRTPVAQVIGIEASLALHQQACLVLQRITRELMLPIAGARSLEFKLGNFLNISWGKPTIAYMCSTCYSPALMQHIGHKINAISSIRQVLSLKPIPSLTRLPFQRTFAVECSWDSAICYYYHNL